MRRCLPLLALLALALTAHGPRAQAQPTAPTLQLEAAFTVEPTAAVRRVKFPDTVAVGNTVHVSANARDLDAIYWAKQDSANSFPAEQKVGNATGQPDFSNAVVALGSNGALYYAWIDRPNEDNEAQEFIYMRKKAAGAADFGPVRQVTGPIDNEFDVNLDMTVIGNNTIVVAWRVSDKASRYSVSTDEGANWSAPTLLRNATGDFSLYFPSMAAGTSNNGVIATTQAVNGQDGLKVFGGIWNGSSFSFGPIATDADYSDPSATVAPNGRTLVTYRRLSPNDSPSSAGVFLAEYFNGSWQQRQVVSNIIAYTSYICADSGNNLHLAWLGQVSGRPKLFYSFAPDGGDFVGTPVEVPFADGDIFNGRLSCNIDAAAGKAYAHFVGEYFVNVAGVDISFLRYNRFSAAITPAVVGPTAKPQIENDVAVVKGNPTVSVNFLEVKGEPTQLRWKWNSAPTDADNDSNGWQPYANPSSITVPEAIRNDTSCKEAKLFVQLANSTNEAGATTSDAIVVDGQVQALVVVTNPYLSTKRSIFDAPALADFGDEGGASDGDPGYTRVPIFYLDLGTPTECSGLKDVATGRSAASIRPAVTVNDNRFANIVPFPGAFAAGGNSVVVRISDKANNVLDVTRSLIYDNTSPVLSSSSPGSLNVTTPLSSTTLLAQLSFSNVQVTDDTYPGKAFWGVWIANSRTQVSNPATDTSLLWKPVAVNGDSGTFTINNWSLATGLPASSLNPGDYFIYVRFLDGAGNPTSGVISGTVNLSEVTRPSLYLPLLRKQQ